MCPLCNSGDLRKEVINSNQCIYKYVRSLSHSRPQSAGLLACSDAAILPGVYELWVEGKKVGIYPGPPGIKSAVVFLLKNLRDICRSGCPVVRLQSPSPGGVLSLYNNAYYLAVVSLPFHITYGPLLLPHLLCLRF